MPRSWHSSTPLPASACTLRAHCHPIWPSLLARSRRTHEAPRQIATDNQGCRQKRWRSLRVPIEPLHYMNVSSAAEENRLWPGNPCPSCWHLAPSAGLCSAAPAAMIVASSMFFWATYPSCRLSGRPLAKIWPRGTRRTQVGTPGLGRSRAFAGNPSPAAANFRRFSSGQSHACTDGILVISARNNRSGHYRKFSCGLCASVADGNPGTWALCTMP
jgi:hypothetical protein